MEKAIYFDMDGTIANLYAVDNWLYHLEHGHTKPNREEKSMVDMRQLGRILNALQNAGYHIGIVSWLSKSGTDEYNARVIETKRKWLLAHLGAVTFDEIKIMGLLFDDEKRNRDNWSGVAEDVNNILEVLKQLI